MASLPNSQLPVLTRESGKDKLMAIIYARGYRVSAGPSLLDVRIDDVPGACERPYVERPSEPSIGDGEPMTVLYIAQVPMNWLRFVAGTLSSLIGNPPSMEWVPDLSTCEPNNYPPTALFLTLPSSYAHAFLNLRHRVVMLADAMLVVPMDAADKLHSRILTRDSTFAALTGSRRKLVQTLSVELARRGRGRGCGSLRWQHNPYSTVCVIIWSHSR